MPSPLDRHPKSIRLRGGVRLLDYALFAGLVLAVLIKALSDLDLTWDTLAYHLPFAARRVGLIPAAAFQFQPWLEQVYQGIPPLPYYLYGGLWRASRNLNTPNIVSGLAFAGYCLLLARLFALPLTVTALAIAAIPVIQVNLPSVYTDLVTNLAFAGALILATAVFMEPAKPMLARVTGAVALAAVSANFKLQFIPIAGVFVPAVLALLFLTRVDGKRRLALLWTETRAATWWRVAALIAAVALCYAVPLRNLILYGNPVFPAGITIAGVRIFPGVQAADIYGDPVYLRGTAQPVRWLISVLEYLAFNYRFLPYSIGQGSVPADAPSLRMGGYLAFFVIYNLALLAWTTLRGHPGAKRLFAVFAVLTVVVACLPGSHELRYYSFWMVYLVSLNFGLLWAWRPSTEGRRHFSFACGAAFLFVASITGWTAFVPAHFTVKRYIASLDLHRIYGAQVRDGATYCLVNWEYRSLLATRYFYGNRPFTVVAEGAACPAGAVVMDLARLRDEKPGGS